MTDLKKLRELAVVIRETDFESEDFNDTLLIDHVVAKGGTMRIAFEMTKPLRDFIATAHPQAIIELLDMVDRYREALEYYGFKLVPDSLNSGKTTITTDTGRIAREALEGGK